MVASAGQAQIVTNTQALGFGSFAAGSGGTLTMSATGLRSRFGGIVLMSSDNGSAGVFSVSGQPNLTYSINLPPNGIVSLSGGTGLPGGTASAPNGASMAVNNFTSKPSLSGVFSSGGTQMLMVGATLSVGNNQANGAYNGTFTVTVNYN
ncbi:DUF4402 domain-containing protein [Glaciimonas sp. GG7]